MDGDGEGDVVGGAGRGAEVEDAELGVGARGREDGGIVRREGGGVGAGVGGEGHEGGGALGGPLYRAEESCVSYLVCLGIDVKGGGVRWKP